MEVPLSGYSTHLGYYSIERPLGELEPAKEEGGNGLVHTWAQGKTERESPSVQHSPWQDRIQSLEDLRERWHETTLRMLDLKRVERKDGLSTKSFFPHRYLRRMLTYLFRRYVRD